MTVAAFNLNIGGSQLQNTDLSTYVGNTLLVFMMYLSKTLNSFYLTSIFRHYEPPIFWVQLATDCVLITKKFSTKKLPCSKKIVLTFTVPHL